MNGKKAKAIRRKAREFTVGKPECEYLAVGKQPVRRIVDGVGKAHFVALPKTRIVNPQTERGAVRGIKRAVRRLGLK